MEAEFFFDRSGRWIWTPYRPRIRDAIDGISDYYSLTGTDNIRNMGYEEPVDDIYTDVRVRFNYNYLEQNPYRFMQTIERTNTTTSGSYYGYNNLKELDSEWIKDRDDAIIVAERFLGNHKDPRPKINFNTSLYGLEGDLDKVVDVTHRTGSLYNRLFRLSDLNINLDSNTISFKARSIDNVSFGQGYGYYSSDEVDFPDAVTTSSRCGWGWARVGSHGTVDALTGQTQFEIRDKDGNIPNVGVDGYTKYITVGSEILRCTSSGVTQNKVWVRGTETTVQGEDIFVGTPWLAWPMDSNGDIVPQWGYGTLLNAPTGMDTVNGTCLNINIGTFGTVWRLF